MISWSFCLAFGLWCFSNLAVETLSTLCPLFFFHSTCVLFIYYIKNLKKNLVYCVITLWYHFSFVGFDCFLKSIWIKVSAKCKKEKMKFGATRGSVKILNLNCALMLLGLRAGWWSSGCLLRPVLQAEQEPGRITHLSPAPDSLERGEKDRWLRQMLRSSENYKSTSVTVK